MPIAKKMLERLSFIELDARSRAQCLMDASHQKELISPFERVISPWLLRQNIVPQSDDGVVVIKGFIEKQPAVVVSIDGAFQGGSLGEVGGAKIASALELAVLDNRSDIPTVVVLLLETGGVRLQEANLGLAAIAEIHAAIVELRKYQPVIAVVAGSVGCFGGMSITAGLCSYVIMTREGRLGLNGPQVIEQEAGIAEYDSRDRPFIWSVTGGEQRFVSGLVDVYVEDDRNKIGAAVKASIKKGIPSTHRSEDVEFYLSKLLSIDVSSQATPEQVRQVFKRGG